MSSGSVLSILVAILFILFYRYRKYWKPAVVSIVLLCVAIEIISTRHFYHYMTRFMMSQSTAWYRGRLLDVALFEGGMSNHWLIGYGINTEKAIKAGAEWGARIDGRDFVDPVNEYVLIIFRFGIITLIPFLAMIFVSIKKIIDTWKMNLSDADRWLIWCLSASWAGLLITMNSVGLFGPPITEFFMMLAICGQVSVFAAKPQESYLRYYPNYSKVTV